MKTQHTPAPWEATETMDNAVLVINDRQEVIAEVTTNIFITNEVTANARLIAAAPELLEALEKLNSINERIQFLKSEDAPVTDYDDWDGLQREWDAIDNELDNAYTTAQKAIDKAKRE
jgi:hypothetical protein